MEYDGAKTAIAAQLRRLQNTENTTMGYNGTWRQSKKIIELINTIKKLDEEDENGTSDPKDKTLKKHFIYSSEGSQCGLSLISKALMDNGFIYTGKEFNKGSDFKNFAFLSTENVKDTAKGTKLSADEVAKYRRFLLPENENEVESEDIHKAFNHPTNSRGKYIRFLLFDKATKEGLDLYDVKYCHILEEPENKADLIQIIGRGTRHCGQRNLNFIDNKGWELQVHQYHIRIPQEIRDLNIFHKGTKLFDHDTMHELNMSLNDNPVDSKEEEMKNDLAMLGHYISVDFPLTQTFINPEIDLFQKYDLPALLAPSTYDEMEPIALYPKYGAVTPKPRKPQVQPHVVSSKQPKTPAPVVSSKQPKTTAGSPSKQPKTPAVAPPPKAPVPREAPSDPGSTLRKAVVVPPKAQTPTPPSSRPRRSQKKFVREKDKIKVSSSFKNAAKQQIKVNPNSPGKRVRSPVDRFKPTDGSYFLDLIQRANALFGSSTGLSSSSSQGSTLSSSPQGSTSSSFQVANVPTTLSRVVSTRTSDHQKLHQLIAKKYGNPSGKQWLIIRPPKRECPELTDVSSPIKPQIATLTPSQVFLTKYFTPESPQKGMLLWHSTGTGKTCTAISMASAEFEKQGYRIVWVTRKTLVADVKKNIYGANICHHRVDPKSQFFEDRKNFFAKKHKTQPSQFGKMGKSWSIEPMTHKQFANYCCGDVKGDWKDRFNKSLKRMNNDDDDDDEEDGGRKPYVPVQKHPCNPNLKTDDFYKTLIIIDEAHYLYSSEKEPGDDWHNAINKRETDAIEKKIRNSYEKSGKNSVRLILMTATPVKKKSSEFFSLINLFKEQDIPKADIDNLSNKSNWLEFIDQHLSGYISYLNRENDPSQFAQVNRECCHHYVNMDQNLKNKILERYKKEYGGNIEIPKNPKSPKTPKDKAPKTPKTPKSPGRVGGKNVCKKCGQAGHYAKTCKN